MRAPLYQPSPDNGFVRRYRSLLTAMGFFSQRAAVGGASEDLWRSIEEQATQDAWWAALGLRRSWLSETSLLALHVWLLHTRFKADFDAPGALNGRRLQEQLFERFWEDTTMRIRNAGIVEVSVNKQLESVQKIVFHDMFAYDAALRADAEADEAGAGMEMAAALWR